MRSVRFFVFTIILLLLAACNAQTPPSQAALMIDTVWLRPALESGNTALYANITNTTDEPIMLTDIAADFAGMVEIHQTVVENDMAQMQHMEHGLRIGAGETIQLQPGGYHVMLINVQQALHEGETVNMTLTFDNGATHTIEAQIRLNADDLE